LQSDISAQQQSIGITRNGDGPLASTGIRFVSVEHEGFSQRCPPEAERLKETFAKLLGCQWMDWNGKRKEIGLNDVLVVSPYNIQVNHLRGVLPHGARVGTIDKF